MAVGNGEVETISLPGNNSGSVMVSKANSEQVHIDSQARNLSGTNYESLARSAHRDSISSSPTVNGRKSSMSLSRQSTAKSKDGDVQGFLYPLDVDSHFQTILKKGPKFLQSYADRTTQQENTNNEFGSQAKRNLPDYYYKNSGDPTSNRWLKNRRCSRPHSRMSSAGSTRPRPPSRQSSSNQLPGMENPRCFASESNNFEIVTPLESLSLTYRGWAVSEQNLKKHMLNFKFPGIRSVRFGEVQKDSAKVSGGDAYTSLPQTPLTSSRQRRNSSKSNRAQPPSGRPQSW